jgi:UPF0716 family protein affecting phage T7 exclusion
LFPGFPVSDTVAKLLLLAPSRVAAEKAAQIASAESGGDFHFWVEPLEPPNM